MAMVCERTRDDFRPLDPGLWGSLYDQHHHFMLIFLQWFSMGDRSEPIPGEQQTQSAVLYR